MRRLLFLAHRMPYPPDKGDKIRAWHLLERLMRTHAVHVGCFIDDPADWAHVPALRARCADLACFGIDPRWRKLRALASLRPGRPLTLGYFDDKRLRRWVRATLARERIDLAFVYSSSMAPYVMDERGLPKLLDLVDMDSAKWAGYADEAGWPMRTIWAREARTLFAFEQEAVRQFDQALFVSDAERQHFARGAPNAAARTAVISNGVDLRYFAPSPRFAAPYPGAAPRILFTGAMDYRPNIDAVTWFAAEVLPLLRRRPVPPAFWIVGANPAPAVRRLASAPGVHVTGRVADIRPYLAHADMVVAPLRMARGIQNKVLEAMAMARPVVATPQAFEGIEAEPGTDLLIAHDAPGMASAIGGVFDGAHGGLGPRARRLVEAHYDWESRLAPLDRFSNIRPAPPPGAARHPAPAAVSV